MTDTVPVPAIDFATFDHDVRIADDLFRHVNGRWIAETEIADDKPMAGSFIALRDAAEAAVRDIITGLTEGEPGSNEAKIADLYASFMDADAVEAAGATPLAGLLAEVDQTDTTAELVRLIGSFYRRGISGLVGIDVESDPGDPQRSVIFVGQSGLGLPDEEYYRLDDHAEIRTKYQAHIAATFALAEVDYPATQAKRVLDLETEIAAAHWDKVKTRDLRLMYNLMTLEDFEQTYEALNWPEYAAGLGIDAETMAELVVMQPSFFSEIGALITRNRLDSWRAWARWKIISSLSPYLSSAFVDERFSFYGTVLSGTPKLKERWKRGVELVEGSLGEAVGQIYVERHFSPTAKERMDRLVGHLIEAYRQSITDLDWMTEDTKKEALDKLAKFRPHIGFPSKWRDYSSLEIRRDDLIGNVSRAVDFEITRNLAKVGQPVDREEWIMTPQTVNAYYHPLRNEIVFPAAILQPPFFNEHADDAVNYGGIGAVIGHEIGHGFDDQGSTCDGDGALRNWWTEDDRAAFEQRTAALIEQYDALEPAQTPGHKVNGSLTIGENIGDLGGLSIALKAFQLASQDVEPEPIDGYTPVQRLFLNWGAIWQSKARTETVLQRLAVDPHAPNEFRCNQIVRNVDAFYEAFDLQPTDALYLDPAKRVSIW
ncbi:M13 family metallopeptidase [Microlunatus parietis]|uniref:Putative endopeptidase n=1 Tax=Microlunatus parietis TaxID=682979 RepID=A0A7Y9I7U5_9ACTN|nr:M13-type metalloendopeptidase [Microlunatus parietis]NYE71359.1 putative endopeptidase [Microlunatus parietis]